MRVKEIIDEDFVNYKNPAMFIATYTCNFKCDKECGRPICQNSSLVKEPTIEMEEKEIVERYFNNKITSAIVLGGLEPLDDTQEVFNLLCEIELYLECNPTAAEPIIIIYTGYNKDEIKNTAQSFSVFDLPIIFKVGRFIPDQKPHYDKLLGVELASENQFSIKLEDILK